MHRGHLDQFLHTEIDTASCGTLPTVDIHADTVREIAALGCDGCLTVHSFETRTGVVGHEELVVEQTGLPVQSLVRGILAAPQPEQYYNRSPRRPPPPSGPWHKKIKRKVSVPLQSSRRG